MTTCLASYRPRSETSLSFASGPGSPLEDLKKADAESARKPLIRAVQRYRPVEAHDVGIDLGDEQAEAHPHVVEGVQRPEVDGRVPYVPEGDGAEAGEQDVDGHGARLDVSEVPRMAGGGSGGAGELVDLVAAHPRVRAGHETS